MDNIDYLLPTILKENIIVSTIIMSYKLKIATYKLEQKS